MCSNVGCVRASETIKLECRRSENAHQAIAVATYSAEVFSVNHTDLPPIRLRESRQVFMIRVRLIVHGSGLGGSS